MKFGNLILAVSFQLLLSDLAFAQQAACNLSQKTILLTMTSCGPYADGRCRRGSEKLEFVGNKILHFENILAQEGMKYTVGQTVDLMADPIQKRQLMSDSLMSAGVYVDAKATAMIAGNQIKILRSRNLFLDQPRNIRGRYYAKNTQLGEGSIAITIFVDPTCSTCKLQEHFNVNKNLLDGSVIEFITSDQSCAISNN